MGGTVIFVSLVVYATAAFVEIIRLNTVDKVIMKSGLIQHVSTTINKVYGIENE